MSIISSQLKSAAGYSLLAAAGITNTGATLISGGNIGSYPTATETGFTGANFTAPATTDNADAATAQADALSAYNFFSAQAFISLSASSANLSALSGGGAPAGTYYPGNYSAGSSMDIPTSITLDARGDSLAVFIFKAGSTVTLESGASVLLINGASAANVVWLVGSSFTQTGNVGATMVGNILANTSISFGGGTFKGRALAGIVAPSGAITIAAALALSVPSSGAGISSVSGNLNSNAVGKNTGAIVYATPLDSRGASVVQAVGATPLTNPTGLVVQQPYQTPVQADDSWRLDLPAGTYRLAIFGVPTSYSTGVPPNVVITPITYQQLRNPVIVVDGSSSYNAN
jgi:hypothetical protein